jgi:hypothetical protein
MALPPVTPGQLPALPKRDHNLLKIPAVTNVVTPASVLAAVPEITHAMVSVKDDGIDSLLVQPTNWNADHKMVLPAAAVVGRDTTGAGPAQCFPLDTATGDSFHMATTDYVREQIAAALGIAAQFDTGDLIASFATTKAGFLVLMGASFGNAGSGATYASADAEKLFKLFWSLNTSTWPVLPSRGASADSDWLANKTMNLPDARGCALAMGDLGAGVTALLDKLAVKVGEAKHSLTYEELAPHSHLVNVSTNDAGGGSLYLMQGQGANPGTNVSAIQQAGGEGAYPRTVKPHNIVQPTMGANIFVKL